MRIIPALLAFLFLMAAPCARAMAQSVGSSTPEQITAQAEALVESGAAILNAAATDREFEMAVKQWEQALELYRKAGNREEEASLWELLAEAHARRGNAASAAHALQQAAALWHGLKDYYSQALAIADLAALYIGQDMHKEARALYSDAAAIYAALKDESGRGRMMLLISQSHRAQWAWREALAAARDALAAFRAAQDPDGQAQALAALASMYIVSGETGEAEKLLEQARALPATEPGARAAVFHTAGDLAAALGNPARAVEQYGMQVALLQESGDLDAAARAQLSLAEALTQNGRQEQALSWIASTLELARSAGDAEMQGDALAASARALYFAGRKNGALMALEQAADAFNRAPRQDKALDSLARAALMAAEIEDPKAAAQRSLLALSAARDRGNTRAEAAMLTLNGNLVLLAGADPARAMDFYDRAADLCRAVKALSCETVAIGNKGLAHARAGDAANAEKFLQEAETRALAADDSESLWRFHAAHAGILRRLGRSGQAAKHLEIAAKALESRHGAAPGRDILAWYPADPESVFSDLAETLLSLDSSSAALAAVDRGAACRAARAGFPADAAPDGPPALPALKQSQAAVVYIPGQDALDIILITSGAALQRLSSHTDRDTLKTLARDILREQDGAPVFNQSAARRLHQILIEPVIPFLGNKDTLIVSSPGFLFTVPFAALPDVQGRYLIQDRAVVMTPDLHTLNALLKGADAHRGISATATLVVQQQPDCTGRSLSIMPRGSCRSLSGNAALTYRTSFASDSKFVLGEYATAQGVESHAGKSAGILQFETNCFVDGPAPGHASVVLFADREENPAADTFTELRGLFAGAAWPPLVVLPHCAPVPDRATAAPGYMLILRDLLGRGARAVITTMQRPGQAAAEQVLIRFYAEMRAGAPPAQALRASQMRMLNDPQFADPAHWAPFFYSGIP